MALQMRVVYIFSLSIPDQPFLRSSRPFFRDSARAQFGGMCASLQSRAITHRETERVALSDSATAALTWRPGLAGRVSAGERVQGLVQRGAGRRWLVGQAVGPAQLAVVEVVVADRPDRR
jgi:hypothetical protein